jgi:hypothetical protein
MAIADVADHNGAREDARVGELLGFHDSRALHAPKAASPRKLNHVHGLDGTVPVSVLIGKLEHETQASGPSPGGDKIPTGDSPRGQ